MLPERKWSWDRPTGLSWFPTVWQASQISLTCDHSCVHTASNSENEYIQNHVKSLHSNHTAIFRDQLNSQFHGRDIFHEIGLLPWKNAYFREIHDFSWILTRLLSFVKVSEFYQQLLCGFCCFLLRVTLPHLIVGMYSLCYLLTSHHTRSTHLLPYYFAIDSFASFVMSRVLLIVNLK